MSVADLFDDSNKYYKDAVDDPLKIIEPLGMSFFKNRDVDNLKRPSNNNNQNIERPPNKQHQQNQGNKNERYSGYVPNTSLQKRNNLKKISSLLQEKDKKLEKIVQNKVSIMRSDLTFLDKLRFEPQKAAQLLQDNDFKTALQNFDKNEYIKQYTSIIDQIKMENYDNLKVIKCQNLLKMLTGFVKKNSLVSSYYHVYGTFENIGYIEYLKKDIEFNMTTSILSVWLQETPKQQNFKNSVHYGEIETYVKDTDQVDIENVESVKQHIEQIKQQAQDQDISYEGMDLYFGVRSCPSAEGYIEQERQCQKRMIFDLTMICNILADQQNCIIKFYHTFTTRTLMILFMFSRIFQTTVMTKPRTSSLTSNARYLHCQNLKQDIARKMGELLLDKYALFMNDETLPFDMKILTQDPKFSYCFINSFLRDLIKMQIDYFESEEFVNRRYLEVVKLELASVFSEPYYKDIVENFQISDMSLKRELGLKDMSRDEALKQVEHIEEELMKQQQQSNNNTENGDNHKKQNAPQFSDEEEDEEDKTANQNSYVNQFIQNQRKKDEEEKQMIEQKKVDPKPIPKKDPNIINQRVDRDLNFTRDLAMSFLPVAIQKPKKKK